MIMAVRYAPPPISKDLRFPVEKRRDRRGRAYCENVACDT